MNTLLYKTLQGKMSLQDIHLALLLLLIFFFLFWVQYIVEVISKIINILNLLMYIYYVYIMSPLGIPKNVDILTENL